MFIELGIGYLLAAMMPGPSIALIIRNCISCSRSAGIQACLGTILGTALQSGIVIGSLEIFSNESSILKCIKIAGSFYLIYLGLKILLYNLVWHTQLESQNLSSFNSRKKVIFGRDF